MALGELDGLRSLGVGIRGSDGKRVGAILASRGDGFPWGVTPAV